MQQLVLGDTEEPLPYVYFSGPLTWYDRNGDSRLSDVLAAADAVEECLHPSGFHVHIPHREYRRTEGRNTHADNAAIIADAVAVVAYYDYPCTGMGQELEIAAAYLRPVVLLINERRDKISTMVGTGPFARIPIVFDDLDGLREALPAVVSALARPYEPALRGAEVEFGERLSATRVKVGISREELARVLGVSLELVVAMESSAVPANPTLWQVAAIAKVLDVEPQTLLGGVADGPDNRARILDYAADHGHTAAEVREVFELAARGADAAALDEDGMRILFDIVGRPESAKG